MSAGVTGLPLVCAACSQSKHCSGCCEARFDDALNSHTLEAMRNRMIALALETHGNRNRAAKALGIGRATLYRWIAEQRKVEA